MHQSLKQNIVQNIYFCILSHLYPHQFLDQCLYNSRLPTAGIGHAFAASSKLQIAKKMLLLRARRGS